ncbi:hypothetical protein VT03_03690 [Planctomyces sp. SH-PL14]|nr:hypothetical protein VT03_03690 [Planctomyces sp. SH-PL14]
MKDLVLLPDEVALLKFAAKQGALNRSGPTLSHDIACDFFCETGLAESDGDHIRLTQLGQRVANAFLCAGVLGTASISRCVLNALGPQVAFTDGAYR